MWEYKVFDRSNFGATNYPIDLEGALNKLGAEGWEIAATVGQGPWILMKRQKDPARIGR